MPLCRQSFIAGTISVLAIGSLLAGCTPSSKPGATSTTHETPRKVAVAGGTTEAGQTAADAIAAGHQTEQPARMVAGPTFPPNELGLVPILEYHGIGARESRWVRKAESFRKDLDWLASHGYVTATTLDMVNGFPDVPAGKKPVVLTFDDARGDQFVASGVDAGGLAIPAPNSGVGIMLDAAKRHPGFGHRASFYLLPVFFEDDKTAGAKLRFLHQNGFELGNHTWTHLMLGKGSPEKIRDELGRLQAAVARHLGPDATSFQTRTVALPNGSIPRSPAQLAAAVGGKGAPYHHEALLLVGANPAHSPYSRQYDPLRLARIQAVDEEWKRWFGRKGPDDMGGTETFEPYVSDGNPQAVTFPARHADRLDRSRLRGATPRVWAGDPEGKPLAGVTVPAQASEATPAQASHGTPARTGEAVPAQASHGTPAQFGEVASTQASHDTPAQPGEAASTQASNVAPQQSAATSAVQPSTVAQVAGGLTMHPGYGKALPPGGRYENGRIFHTVQKGQSFERLYWRYLEFTDAYTPAELRDQIVRHNRMKHDWVSPGQTLEIPGVRKAPPRPKPREVAPTFEAKGIYATSTTAGFERIFERARALKAVGGNTVVFDVKDGPIAYESKDPMVREYSQWDHTIKDLPKLVERLHDMGIHVVARQVLFNDPVLAKKHPELAIRSKSTGKPWLEHGKLRWVDPSQPRVQEYNIRLAKELATSGVDEIQFDYVRFPAQGNTKDCKFAFDEARMDKHDVITGFLRRAREELKPYKVLISIDVYGVMAWQKDVDLRVTGQKLEEMARYVDVISPMVYPSHFYGPFDGFARPANEPYYFVSQGVERVRRMLGPNGPVIRPWLQAFPYLVSNYNPSYVTKQLQAARDAKAIGWLLWNASNKYDIAFAGVAQWNRIEKSTPIVAVKVKGEGEKAAKAGAGAAQGAAAAASLKRATN